MRLAGVLFGIYLAVVSAPAMAETIVDGNFADWSFSSYGAGTGSAAMTVESSGGHPGARLNVTTVTGAGDTFFGTGIKDDFSTTAPLSGEFTLSLDVLSGPGGFGQGQFVDLLVEQNGTIYATALGVTGWPFNTFTTLSFPGTFDASSFGRVIGAGPTQPVFDGSVSTKFGFAAGNTDSGDLTQYYDNFRLDVPSLSGASAAPTLTPMGLALLTVLLVAAGVRSARQRRTA